jgi:hypothetical protein
VAATPLVLPGAVTKFGSDAGTSAFTTAAQVSAAEAALISF